ncbi:hypothetical protein J6590_017629 [Homalodisca vitripennis]|nr:hypothetical protein J6590_017629 [Homalodisca vitripennis]
MGHFNGPQTSETTMDVMGFHWATIPNADSTFSTPMTDYWFQTTRHSETETNFHYSQPYTKSVSYMGTKALAASRLHCTRVRFRRGSK